MSGAWESAVIVLDHRIDQDDPRVRLVAERLHRNESIDKHHLNNPTTSTHAVRELDRITVPECDPS